MWKQYTLTKIKMGEGDSPVMNKAQNEGVEGVGDVLQVFGQLSQIGDFLAVEESKPTTKAIGTFQPILDPFSDSQTYFQVVLLLILIIFCLLLLLLALSCLLCSQCWRCKRSQKGLGIPNRASTIVPLDPCFHPTLQGWGMESREESNCGEEGGTEESLEEGAFTLASESWYVKDIRDAMDREDQIGRTFCV